jgi:predicted Zn-dependent peptidase
MKYLTSYLIAMLLFLGLTSEAQRETPPSAGKPLDFNLPVKNTEILGNGMKANYVQYGIVPKVTVNLIIKTGNMHEAANQVWLSDLTGNLMREGTTSMNFAAISKKVASMGGELNINVGVSQTTISSSVLSEFAGNLIEIMSELVMHPSFPESEIDRLKNDLKRQLAVQKSRPQSLASEKFNQVIYPDHPYGRYFPTEEMLNSYTIEMVKSFYNQNFGAKRSVLYVVGKFDEQEVSKAVNKSFASWTSGPEIEYPKVIENHTSNVFLIDRKGAPQTTIILGLPTITPLSKDYVALELTNSLLGGSFGSRITTNIREDKGYTYSPYSVVRNMPGSSLWYENADVASEFTGASLKEIFKEIKRLQDEVPSKEEMEGIQNYEAGIFVLTNSSPEGIIGQLNFIDTYGLDDSYLSGQIKNIYAVTPEKVSQMTKDLLRIEDLTIVMVGDSTTVKTQYKEVKDYRTIK